jgi:hypothetical protein
MVVRILMFFFVLQKLGMGGPDDDLEDDDEDDTADSANKGIFSLSPV